MRFSDYAREWLYGENGYYRSYKTIGQSGDFYTSVSLTPFFGGAIASHIVRMARSGTLAENAVACEFGAHDGRLIADAIQFIYTLEPSLIKSLKFAIVEPIAELRRIQSEYLTASFGDAIDLLIAPSIDQIKAKSAFVYANELFDAFSFELIDGGKMAFVEDGRIVWRAADNETTKRANALGVERGELFLGYETFARALVNSFEKCEFLAFDYGIDAPRNDFSARIYAAHKSVPIFETATLEPFFAKSDLTADAPFWHIRRAFLDAGFTSAEIKNQNDALLEMGLADLLELYQEKAGFNAYQKEIGRVRALLDPAQLGERFKRFAASY
ncbi:MAG: SAM-dependent methyltransferase [Helicobacteraceae bacterium]|jgi:SAM-dependent MidA family methyltransferase|nr:SAM-dependent methyltransferase [Helicobacteraceae bacterium]